MNRVLTEPLVHFVLLGAALFVAFSFVSDREQPGDKEIVVSGGKIEHLAAIFARTWQRPPTREELDGLINDFVREEAAYREGMAVGLDRDDTIIRRRVRQKLDFIAEDVANLAEPSDDELVAYLAAHPEDFRVEPRFTFRHIYLNRDQRGEAVETDAHDLLTALKDDPTIDASTLGDPILLEHGYAEIATRDVARLFGQRFAAAIVEIEMGSWQGPIESGYGLHLVLVDERREGRLPELEEVRAQVRREWDKARRVEAIEQFYRAMLDRYEIVIQWPEPRAQEEDS